MEPTYTWYNLTANDLRFLVRALRYTIKHSDSNTREMTPLPDLLKRLRELQTTI